MPLLFTYLTVAVFLFVYFVLYKRRCSSKKSMSVIRMMFDKEQCGSGIILFVLCFILSLLWLPLWIYVLVRNYQCERRNKRLDDAPHKN